MTTDNRTNEPTDAQIEAAAKAIEKIPHIVWNSPRRQGAITLARAALVAAQEAAPQADVEEACRKAGCWEAAYCSHAPLPVLPSSGVDEGKVAVLGGYVERSASQADADFIASARESVPKLIAALEAVEALHRRNGPDDGTCQGDVPMAGRYGYLEEWCVECSDQSGREYGTVWPCATYRAVEAALGGESE